MIPFFFLLLTLSYTIIIIISYSTIIITATSIYNNKGYSTHWQGEIQLNVFDAPLQTCSITPRTGFYRNGNCTTSLEDRGAHVICVEMTWTFLNYSKATGNDLITPAPEYHFPGLVEGDSWCVCADRWRDAMRAGKGIAAPVFLPATHKRALEYLTLDELKSYSSIKSKQIYCDVDNTNSNECSVTTTSISTSSTH
jgi:uncharacterized protein (DUF2237 family)